MSNKILVGGLVVLTLVSSGAEAQSAADLAVLKGLSPVTTLRKTEAGRAALGANFTITVGIQSGEIRQPALAPFPEQQQLALRDVFQTGGNLAQLSDGLGTTLGAAYVARAHYIDRDRFTSLSQRVADLIAYTRAATRSNSNSAKYFFANLTIDGKTPASAEATALLEDSGGSPDMFGHAYGVPAGSPGAGNYGGARPFQVEAALTRIVGRDYFGTPADNLVYNRGPMMNLTNNPSYPSGHTTYSYTGAVILGVLVPERYPEMIVRAAEYGNHRVIVGAHYAMDVIAGRTLALYAMAHLLANDPAYVGQSLGSVTTIADFRAAVAAARADVVQTLEAACGKTVAECAREDIGRLSDPAANEAFYAATQTYGLPVVHPEQARAVVDVAKAAPEAGYLLTVAFPSLTLDQANAILTNTLGPGGGFLDNGSAFGIYSRLNLHAATLQAARLAGRR